MVTDKKQIKLSQLPIGSIFSFHYCGYGYKLTDVIYCAHTDTIYYQYCYYHVYSSGADKLAYKTRTRDANIYPVYINNVI